MKCAPTASCWYANRQRVAARATLLFILMMEITNKVKPGAPVAGQTQLALRVAPEAQFSSKLQSGEQASLRLPRGQILRGGDLLRTSDGGVDRSHRRAGKSVVRSRRHRRLARRRIIWAIAMSQCKWAMVSCALAKIRCWKRCCMAWARKCAASRRPSNPRRALTPMAIVIARRGRPGRIHESEPVPVTSSK